MNEEDLSKKIEAVLYFKGEPVSKSALSRLLSASEEKIENGIYKLRRSLSGRGVTIVENQGRISLGTSPEVSNFIERLSKEDVEKDLTKASLETLSIILYQGPLERSEIDFIRGVNSTFILRSLLIRGLIDRKPSSVDRRTYVYQPSGKLLEHLGVTKIDELPNLEEVRSKIEEFKKSFETDES